MSEAPEPVLLFIPLMKELGMSWEEIMRTPRRILEGILMSLMEYNVLHSMDGYTDSDVGEMAKKKPEIRSHYVNYLEKKRKYYKGAKEKQSFSGLI
jgi:hypothetical protein|tara:strand:- start:1992 stop:2279 length:288 start_codon:yes stop_codon:yes gene_type:complete